MDEETGMWKVSFQEGEVSPSWSTLVEDLAFGSTQAETDGFNEPWRQFTFFRSLVEEILSFNSNKVGANAMGRSWRNLKRKEKCSKNFQMATNILRLFDGYFSIDTELEFAGVAGPICWVGSPYNL